MDIDSSHPLPHPKRLKTLASNVEYPGGNTLLQQLVLDHSEPNTSGSESYIHAVLLSLCDMDVNAANNEGCTALHLAVRKKNLLMVKKLLSCLPTMDVNKSKRDWKREAALHMAVKLGPVSIVEELLKKGADVNIRDSYSDTPLCVAGDFDTMKLLVSQGADVNPRGANTSPLHRAAESGNLEAVQFLVSHGADWSAAGSHNWTVLHAAALSGDLATVEFVVSKGADVNAKAMFGYTPLSCAVIWGHVTIVEFLVSKGADLIAENGRFPPLQDAARCGRLDVIQFLLDRVSDVDIDCLLLSAAESGHLETLQFLFDKGARVNARDPSCKWTPLHYVVKKSSNLAAVQLLVSRGADLKAGDSEGRTPLHDAVSRHSLEMAAFLIEQGADVEARDVKGRTPLHVAVSRNKLKFAELLFDNGADFNTRDEHGQTLLYTAVWSHHSDCVLWLLERGGADVNLADGEGWTALHAAAQRGGADMVGVLLERGADRKARNKSGQTPLDLAQDPLCRDILQQA